MVTASSTYAFEYKNKDQKKSDKELEFIIANIQKYLKNYDRKRFFLSVSVKYHKRCCKSWAKISVHLQKFLNDPKANFTILMRVLEHEVQKFPRGSYYCKQLYRLIHLLQQGPRFSNHQSFRL